MTPQKPIPPAFPTFAAENFTMKVTIEFFLLFCATGSLGTARCDARIIESLSATTLIADLDPGAIPSIGR